MSQKQEHVGEEVAKIADEAIAAIERISKETGDNFERAASPFRKKVLKRFPTLFLLLVTFGVIATSLGIELLVIKHTNLNEHPLLLVILGLVTLVFTGTLYKKLG